MALILTATLMLGACSQLGVYKRDIPQGNYISQSMVEQLRPGMRQQEVIDVMGHPLLEAPFDARRWDYIYRLDEAYGETRTRRVSLAFDDNGTLSRIRQEGDMSHSDSMDKMMKTPSSR